MIQSILTGASQWTQELIYAITHPLDALIDLYFPSLGALINLFGEFVDWVITFFPWVLSWFHIPKFLVLCSCLLIIGYTIILITSNAVKLLLRYWDLLFI